MTLRACPFVGITGPHHLMTAGPHLVGTVAWSGPRGGWRELPIMAYFGIFEIFDPSRIRLYIGPCWPTTNPTIG